MYFYTKYHSHSYFRLFSCAANIVYHNFSALSRCKFILPSPLSQINNRTVYLCLNRRFGKGKKIHRPKNERCKIIPNSDFKTDSTFRFSCFYKLFRNSFSWYCPPFIIIYWYYIPKIARCQAELIKTLDFIKTI